MNVKNGGEVWMDAKQFSELTEAQRFALAAVVEKYENAVASSKKTLTEQIALIIEGKLDQLDLT